LVFETISNFLQVLAEASGGGTGAGEGGADGGEREDHDVDVFHCAELAKRILAPMQREKVQQKTGRPRWTARLG